VHSASRLWRPRTGATFRLPGDGRRSSRCGSSPRSLYSAPSSGRAGSSSPSWAASPRSGCGPCCRPRGRSTPSRPCTRPSECSLTSPSPLPWCWPSGSERCRRCSEGSSPVSRSRRCTAWGRGSSPTVSAPSIRSRDTGCPSRSATGTGSGSSLPWASCWRSAWQPERGRWWRAASPVRCPSCCCRLSTSRSGAGLGSRSQSPLWPRSRSTHAGFSCWLPHSSSGLPQRRVRWWPRGTTRSVVRMRRSPLRRTTGIGLPSSSPYSQRSAPLPRSLSHSASGESPSRRRFAAALHSASFSSPWPRSPPSSSATGADHARRQGSRLVLGAAPAHRQRHRRSVVLVLR
jgi:hypothetical protein